jgi:hypothetical protein
MMSTRKSASDSKTYRLKVTLRGSRPAIWRRLEVDPGVTLARLHDILQVVMGWTDSHLHQFRRGATYYGQPDPEMGMEQENERRVVLRQVLRRPKDRMVYEYDFGDGWEHDVVLEAIGDAGRKKPPTRVLAGKGACPPEDVGGLGGYYRFLEAIQNPKHPEHADMVEWGGPFDPDAFDVDEIDEYFQK